VDFNADGIIECRHCDGQRIIPMRSHGLAEICPACKGTGGRDWIDHAMGRTTDNQQMCYNIASKNIHLLTQMIRDEAMKVGRYVMVDIFEQEPPKYKWKIPSSVVDSMRGY